MVVKKKKTRKSKSTPHKKKFKRTIDRENYHLPVRTEEEQLEGLSEDLLQAWDRLRSFLVSLGDQRIHTSHRSIMFSRKTCYLFVRPKKSFLEINFFLNRSLNSELIHKTQSVSKIKTVHVVRVTHSDQIDLPLTDWIGEGYQLSG